MKYLYKISWIVTSISFFSVFAILALANILNLKMGYEEVLDLLRPTGLFILFSFMISAAVLTVGTIEWIFSLSIQTSLKLVGTFFILCGFPLSGIIWAFWMSRKTRLFGINK